MKSTSECLEILRKYKAENAGNYGILKIGIFGSVARGEQKEDSDVDIYIEGEAQSLITMAHIKNDLERLFGRKVDIVRFREQMNLFLKKRIIEDGIYV